MEGKDTEQASLETAANLSDREKELLEAGYVSKGDPFWKKDGKLFELKNGTRMVEVLDQKKKDAHSEEEKAGFRPGNQLVRQEPFVQMDKMDEEQILAELRGEVLEQMVYVVKQAGKKIKSLSWAGVKTVALLQAEKGHPISIEDVKVDEKEKGYVAMAIAMNLNSGEKRWGVAEQSYLMEVKERGPDGKPTGKTYEVDDNFALAKVFSKAQRNAMRALLPEQAVAAMISRWLEDQKGGAKRGA